MDGRDSRWKLFSNILSTPGLETITFYFRAWESLIFFVFLLTILKQLQNNETAMDILCVRHENVFKYTKIQSLSNRMFASTQKIIDMLFSVGLIKHSTSA